MLFCAPMNVRSSFLSLASVGVFFGMINACGGAGNEGSTTPPPRTDSRASVAIPPEGNSGTMSNATQVATAPSMYEGAPAETPPPSMGTPTPTGTAEATPSAETTESTDAPADDAAWTAKVAAGRRTYNRFCAATCHGAGGNEGDDGPAIRGKNLSVAAMRKQIREGSTHMRPIPPARLAEDQMDGLLAYLSTIRAARGVQRP